MRQIAPAMSAEKPMIGLPHSTWMFVTAKMPNSKRNTPKRIKTHPSRFGMVGFLAAQKNLRQNGLIQNHAPTGWVSLDQPPTQVSFFRESALPGRLDGWNVPAISSDCQSGVVRMLGSSP
jgi:hypothetical protein